MAENVKTAQGLAIASVKTLQGLAIASVQTINGVDNTAGGPTLIASENFDGLLTGNPLGGQGDWVNTSGGINVLGSGDNYVVPSNGTIGIDYYNTTFSTNQRAEMTMKAFGTSDSFAWIGPAVRCQAGSASAYGVIFGLDDLYLVKFNSGTQATINSDTTTTWSVGNKVAIEVSGAGSSARLKVQVDTGSGWVDKWTNQDPGGTYLDGGFAGICSWLASETSNRADDWAGYDL